MGLRVHIPMDRFLTALFYRDGEGGWNDSALEAWLVGPPDRWTVTDLAIIDGRVAMRVDLKGEDS